MQQIHNNWRDPGSSIINAVSLLHVLTGSYSRVPLHKAYA